MLGQTMYGTIYSIDIENSRNVKSRKDKYKQGGSGGIKIIQIFVKLLRLY